ncbi:Uncharacterised protein [Mycobacteroides abscessus subsp. massiliense]|nr:Uncharacterised protein [Mycobacteroides abscessus subsp. massiliense]
MPVRADDQEPLRRITGELRTGLEEPVGVLIAALHTPVTVVVHRRCLDDDWFPGQVEHPARIQRGGVDGGGDPAGLGVEQVQLRLDTVDSAEGGTVLLGVDEAQLVEAGDIQAPVERLAGDPLDVRSGQ